MENIETHIKEFKKSLRKLLEINEKNLEKIKEQNPESFKKISIDTAKIEKAIREKDFESLLKLQKDYANHTDK